VKVDLSIIITHFNPSNSNKENPLIKTLQIIDEQKSNCNVEIIIADDGSCYSKEIMNQNLEKYKLKNDERSIYFSKNKKLKLLFKKIGFESKLISHWVYLPKMRQCMSKARVLNHAVKVSTSENLLFIDDDNYFISNNSIQEIINLFSNYQFLVGQIKDNNGKFRKFESKRVQGTTIGIKKNIFIDINGFGEWTEEFSCGVDSDFWIKVFNYFKYNKSLKACYTDKFSTYDSYSKRWKVYTKFLQDFKLKKKFKILYKCKNYKSHIHNQSRNKKLWIDNLIK